MATATSHRRSIMHAHTHTLTHTSGRSSRIPSTSSTRSRRYETSTATVHQDNSAKPAAIVELQQTLSLALRLNDYQIATSAIAGSSTFALDPLPFPLTKKVAGGTIGLEAAEDETKKKRIVLNGEVFFGTPNSDFLFLLSELCSMLCDSIKDIKPRSRSRRSTSRGIRPKTLYEDIVTRISSRSSLDSYFQLDSTLGSSKIMIMPLKNNKPPVASGIELYATSGTIHADITSIERYGLFRKGVHTSSNKPWIMIDGITRQRINYSTGQSIRYVRAKVVQ